MTINYWRVFLGGAALLAGLILLRWVRDAAGGILDLLPSQSHPTNYNLAAMAMFAITAWGIARLRR